MAKRQINKKGLIVGLTVGIPAAVGLATTLAVCIRPKAAVTYDVIPTDMFDIDENNITLNGFKKDADYAKYTTLSIPSTIRVISKEAFKDTLSINKTVNTLIFPKSIRKVEVNAFKGCKGIATIDLTDIDEESAKLIEWEDMFGDDKPAFVSFKFNSGLTSEAKEELIERLINNGKCKEEWFVEKSNGHVVPVAESQTKETCAVAENEMEVKFTDEEKADFAESKVTFTVAAVRTGGTTGVGIKVSNMQITPVEVAANASKKYMATIDAEILNAKKAGEYVTYSVNVVFKDSKANKTWVQQMDNFKLVYKAAPAKLVESIEITNDASTPLYQGEPVKLTASVLPEDATTKDVKFYIDQMDGVEAASIDGDTITGLVPGAKAKVYAKATDGSGVISAVKEFTVHDPAIHVTDVKMDKEYCGLWMPSSPAQMPTTQLTANVYPTTATDPSVTWKSSDDNIATVDPTGKVTAVAEGTVTITATSNDRPQCVGTCTLTIGKFEYLETVSSGKAGESLIQLKSGTTAASIFAIPEIDAAGNKIVGIATNGFASNTNIQEMYIPSTIATIGSGAFQNSALTKVVFEENSKITEIPFNCFASSQLSSINIPDSIKTIGGSSFSNTKLHDIVFSENSELETIKYSAFAGTVTLHQGSLVIPKKLKTIEHSAFAFGTGVGAEIGQFTSVTFLDTTSDWNVYENGKTTPIVQTFTPSGDPTTNALIINGLKQGNWFQKVTA